MQVTVSVEAIYMTVSSNNFIFFSLTPTFHKIDQKTFTWIVSDFHFTTFVNILSKLRYFVDRNCIQIDYKSHSLLLFSQLRYKRWEHLGFLERRES